MCSDGYSTNCCPNEQVQRIEIMSILTQASMNTK
jgi:hypothetical protein